MRGHVLVAAGAIGTLALFFFTSPLPQDIAYHDFADARRIAGINNFLDVMSNLPFLAIGVWGLIMSRGNSVEAGTRPALTVFFAGVALTAFGSAWYHYAPSNDTLFWDRLPMTLAFMGLVAIIIGEYGNRETGHRLLPWLLAAGAASAMYWAWTESRGVGDLRPYAIVQFLPMLAIPVVLLVSGRRSQLTGAFWLMIGAYVLAKVLEFADVQVYAATGSISGHSLKHLAAALAPLTLLLAIRRNARRPRSSPSGLPR